MFNPQFLEVLSDGSEDTATIVRTAEIELYCNVAMASLLLYHAITTMDSEVKYFWRGLTRPVTFVYFMNRYAGLLSIFISIQLHIFNVPAPICTSVTWIHNITDWATVLLIDYILLIRVLALYSRDRWLSVILSSMLALEATLRLAFMIVAVSAEVAQQKNLMPESACIQQNKCSRRTLETLYWVTPLIYQVILAILATCKASEYWRMSAGFKGFTLVKVLIEDQFVYFGGVIVCGVINILKCYIKETPALDGAATVFGSTSFLCLLGSVLLLRLKEAGERGQKEGTSYRTPTKTVSHMQFSIVNQPNRSGHY